MAEETAEDKKQLEDYLENVKVFMRVFDSPDGIKVLNILCEKVKFFEGTTQYSKHRVDPYASVYNDGQRDVILYILKTLDVNISELRHIYTKRSQELMDTWGNSLIKKGE